MAFTPEPTRTPSSIGRIIVELTTEPLGVQEAEFDITIGFDDGSTQTRRGNLVPHITTAQRTALMGFMDDLRTQAEQQIL